MKKELRHKEIKKDNNVSVKYLLYMLFALILAIVTYNVYSPIKKNKLTNWDDDRYIVNNLDIQKKLDAKSIKQLSTEEYEGNYHPVTMISYALNYNQGKLNPQTYLNTNRNFHIASTVLVFIFILLIANNVTISFITALLFGIHPMHVESVAWASERKDVLYCFFFLLSLILYVVYIKKENWIYLLFSVFFFLISLLSKAMAVPLAGVIIIVDLVFKRQYLITSEKLSVRKINWWILLEKAPYFLFAIYYGLRAVKAQKLLGEGPLGMMIDFSFLERLGLASYSFVKYIFLLIAPHNLSAFYPYPEAFHLYYWIFVFLVIGFFLGLIFFFIKKFPLSTNVRLYYFGVLFFIFNIILVLQIKPVGQAIMADRYTYVSAIGLFLIVGLLINDTSTRFPKAKYICYVLFIGYSIILSIATYDRCKVWKDSISLWNDVIQKHPNVDMAVNNRGLAKQDNGDLAGAFEDYKRTSEINPRFALAWNNMGSIKAQFNKQEEAIGYFNKALQINPMLVNTYANRAKSKSALNDHQGAIIDYSKYIEIFAGNPDIINDRGLEKYHLKDYKEAIKDFDNAIELGEKVNSPTTHLYYINRGLSKAFSNDMKGAFEDYNHAIELVPEYPQSHFNLGVLQCYVGNRKDGCVNIQKAANYGYQTAIEYYSQYCKQ